MDQMQAIRNIRLVFALMAFALVFAWGTNMANAQALGSSVSIAPNGQVMVKDATVVSVFGSVIYAKTKWAGSEITWTVQTSGSTKFTPDLGSASALSHMKPGDTLSFSGVLGEAGLTVRAASVRNAELVQSSVSILGKVTSVSTNDNAFTLQADSEEVRIVLDRGTLMSRDGGYMDIRDVQVGDSAKVIGLRHTQSGKLEAERIWLKAPEVVEEESQESEGDKEGVLASVWSWLKGSRGILSIRDR